jgi:hypothetical protein
MSTRRWPKIAQRVLLALGFYRPRSPNGEGFSGPHRQSLLSAGARESPSCTPPKPVLTLTHRQPRLGGSFLVLARGVCCAQLNGKQEVLPEPRSCQPALPPQRSSENRVAWFYPVFSHLAR